jgi:hypothetical protein
VSAEPVDNLTRLAMLEAWNASCVWCGRPLFFNQMEAEHLIPRSLGDESNAPKRAEVLQIHGLGADYDVDALENLAPSCRACNSGKGSKSPPDTPGIALLLEKSRARAPAIRTAAKKMRGDRVIERAAAVLRAGAEEGNPKAVDELREAANVLSQAVERATGQAVSRLHSALDGLASAGTAIAQGDAHFDYLATTGPTGGPSHEVAKGAVMTYSETHGSVTSRIDVIPRDDEALERYGPKVSLSLADGEAGVRAAALLNDALRDGRSVEITEGLEVTFDRLPPLFADRAGKPLSGGSVRVALYNDSPQRRPVPAWRAEMRMSSPSGSSATLHVRLEEVDNAPEGWDGALMGHKAGMTVTALFRRNAHGGQIQFNFKHVLDDSPIRRQLAGARFLEAVRRGGELVVIDRGGTERPQLQLVQEAEETPPQDRAFIALLEDLALIEDRSGAKFSLPEEISADDVRHIADIAALIRDGSRSITWSNATMTVLEPGVAKLREGGVMRMEETISTVILGLEVELGVLRRDIPEYEFVEATPVVDPEGSFRVTIKPPTTEAAKIREVLLERPAAQRRPPPPPPRKKHSRKRKRKRK